MKRLASALATLAVLPAAADFRYSPTHLQLYAPGAPWALAVPREDWKLVQEERRPDGQAFYYMAGSSRGLQFSVYLDKTTECDSGPSCRKLFQSAAHPSLDGAKVLQEAERNGFSILVYQTPGVRVGERTLGITNVSAHAYRDGRWIDFRVSSAGATPPEPAPLLAILDGIALAPPALDGPRRYPVAGALFLEMDVPAQWRDELTPGRIPTVRLVPATGKDFMMLASLVVPPQGKSAEPAAERSKASVRRAADAALQRAVERSVDLVPFEGPDARGHYFTVTDRAPEPGGYRHMSQGEVVVANVAVTFTILSNDGQEATVRQALEAVRGLRLR